MESTKDIMGDELRRIQAKIEQKEAEITEEKKEVVTFRGMIYRQL